MGKYYIDANWRIQSGRNDGATGMSRAAFEKLLDDLAQDGGHFQVEAQIEYHD